MEDLSVNPLVQSQTHYVAIASPPTPAPSPGPSHSNIPRKRLSQAIGALSFSFGSSIPTQDSPMRRQFLTDVLNSCTPSELLFISTTIAPRLKRDFLYSLPPELAIHILGYIDDPRTLARAAQVSKHWNRLVHDEFVWKRMCMWYGFVNALDLESEGRERAPLETSYEDKIEKWPSVNVLQKTVSEGRLARDSDYLQQLACHNKLLSPQVYHQHFKSSYMTMMNWRHGGHLLRSHRMPVINPDMGVITSLALDKDWVVVGLANSKILVFSAHTGVLQRTLVGHDSGVWGVCLVSGSSHAVSDDTGRKTHRRRVFSGGLAPQTSSSEPQSFESALPPALRYALGLNTDIDGMRSSPDFTRTSSKSVGSDQCYSSKGWGQPNALVVSGGCDKVLRVWDVQSGLCIYELPGHSSTIRCIRTLDNRPIAVTGSRDATLRVWDIQRGRMLRILEGHHQSVRCLDVCGNKVVSGSYDTTCRLWDVDTGECLHVLRGHFHQIYSVAYDGVRIASGGLDTTVRVWDAVTGRCLALLQGHTALVCQLQLSPTLLVTGGSDGRVITFSLSPYNVVHRIAAHDSSVTSLQFDNNFLVTAGNDGRVRLYETQTGNYVRDLSEPSENVWKVAFGRETCAVMCRRAGQTVMEIWSMKPTETA
ncbi:hypothetical protein AMATHDRAFT_3485 [Amanita thiersii Skay4041]|uniref:F-box domain-containing protein n=1 Tax=Amanita thiersii Skay4041 TaxID=703135 RepID=A0A2A9NT78_9AGAR|nr:hypothetical protein AMATHDRAFT_3485 [Amanita thiersii Skay4041]